MTCKSAFIITGQSQCGPTIVLPEYASLRSHSLQEAF